MHHLNLLCFLVFSIASCHGAGGGVEDRGVVIDFAPSGDFRYIYSRHEKEKPLVNWWIKKDNNDFILYVCTKIELNANTPNVISQFRATIVTNEKLELDSFKVTECNQEKLLTSIIVSQTKDVKNTREYQIMFKDTDNNCRLRTYQVSITPDLVDSTVTITRGPVTNLPYGYQTKCTISKNIKGLVSDWYDDGKNHDYILFYEYNPIMRFGGDKCDRCWILCTETTKPPKDAIQGDTIKQKQSSAPENEKIHIVEVLISETPVDRIKVSSCSDFALKISIKYDFKLKLDDRNTGVYINYLKTDGTCFSRKYQYDIQLHKDLMFQRIFVKRENPSVNRGCKTMKAQGMLRSYVNIAKRHIGRVTNRLITWKGQDDDE